MASVLPSRDVCVTSRLDSDTHNKINIKDNFKEAKNSERVTCQDFSGQLDCSQLILFLSTPKMAGGIAAEYSQTAPAHLLRFTEADA